MGGLDLVLLSFPVMSTRAVFRYCFHVGLLGDAQIID